MSPCARRIAAALALVVAAVACQDAGAVTPLDPGSGSTKPVAADWESVERLVEEQKLEEAAAKVDAIVAAAEAARDDHALAKGLIRRAQLRIALGGFETAVEQLKASRWPEAMVPRSAVELYFAHALLDYQAAYDWEIRQRELVASDETLDLKLWTAKQIAAEAERAFLAVWERREALGAVAADDFPYLRANDYPDGIRDTLRDAVSYLFVDRMLADSSFWTPAQSNELWRVDLETLLAERPELPEGAVHPLLRAAAVLADLERWHRSRGEPGAELEARLARVRLLASHFVDAASGERLRADLERTLPRFRRDPWWSEGMATLAERVESGEAPDRRIRAREIAQQAEKAYPTSYGGRRARQIRERIEAPDFSVQTMAVDGAGRRSLEITHRNLGALHFRAYRVDLDERLRSKEFRGFFPQQEREIESAMRGEPAAAWTVELPATRDLFDHRTFATPPLTRSGLYLLVASAEPSFRDRDNRRVGLPFTLSDLVLLDERASSPWEVRLLSGGSGKPAAGVPVTLYANSWREAPKPVETVTTDADGRARFAEAAAAEPRNLLLVARRGDDVALSQRYGRPHRPERRESTGALLFTDRAVYRPEQKLQWKVLGYRAGSSRGDLKPAPGTAVEVWLNDPNGEKVAFQQVRTNEFGAAAGEFVVPAGRLLGQWFLYSSLGGSQAVRIEEYKRPTFEVEIAPPATALRLNRAAKLTGEARYYFGLPVTSGAVAWRVTRQPELPWWARWWGGGWPGATAAQPIAAGSAALDAAGRFTIDFVPAADERQKKSGFTYRYAIEADVTDDGGETRTGSRSVRLGWSAVEAELDPGDDLRLEERPFTVAATRRDLDGNGRAGKGSWRLVAIAQPASAPLPAELPLRAPSDPVPPGAEFETPGDALRARWGNAQEAQAMLRFFGDGREVARGEVSHGETGRGEIRLGGLAAGAYRLHYETTDDQGERSETHRDFVVAGRATQLALPLELAFEHATAQPGDTTRIWLHSGNAAAPVQLEIYRGDELVSRRRLELTGSMFVDVAVSEKDRGGLAARATRVADHQMLSAGDTLAVPWKNRELAVEISTFRDHLTPGAKERFRVTVKGAEGRAVEAGAAEVLASMHDRSLDLFAPFAAPRALALFPSGTYFPPLASNLGAAGPLWYRDLGWVEIADLATLAGDAFIEISPYGIGGPGGRFGSPRMRAMAKGGVAMEETRMADAAMPASAPAPAPQALGEAVSLEAGVIGGAVRAEGSDEPAAVALRADFAETAFWRPQLLTGADGSATIEFTLPDSVTSWRVWAAALTKSLASGYAEIEIDSVKELMVRPYLPRFLREGDRAELKVVVNDARAKDGAPLAGEAKLEIFDPETNASLLAEFGLTEATARKSFRVEPGKGVDLLFPISAPKRVGATAFKVVATAGALSDGELRPLPLLPSRIHLAQSRFVALSNADRREMTFDDMRKADPTRIHEQLVVTVDGQLFYSMLDALPYLIDYPYECTEQTMNRFVSTGMLSSLFEAYPALAKMAAEMAKRETPFERFDAADPNRRMGLEETPWLRQSRGESDFANDSLRVLDPKIANAQREDALAKLAKAQLPNGGFPWFAGGPASPYMTLYLMSGFARATEFEVEVPKEMVQRGWSYLAREAKQDWLPKALKDDCCWELLSFLNYVASSYPDPSWVGGFLDESDRKKILDFSFKHWKEHQPLLKLQLALTLQRMNRSKDAQLVLASVMDSAKTTRDEGTYWQPEDRAWLWYNDRIETHAWALRALMEIAPSDARRDGLVHWLFLNKKLNHWKSTRATAEVLYSLAWYLKATGQLAVREEATVTAANQKTTFVFEPDRFTGKKNQIVVAGDKLDAVKRPADATVIVEKETKGLLFASATWQFSTEELPAEARGDLFGVTRRYFQRVKSGEEVTLLPIGPGAKLQVGDEVEVQLSLRAKAPAEYVHLRDPRPAGLEPDRSDSGWKWDLGLARYEETRDSGTNFFMERLPAGEYTLKYRLRANLAGEFRSAPAQVQSIYAPEFVAYSAGERLAIAPR